MTVTTALLAIFVTMKKVIISKSSESALSKDEKELLDLSLGRIKPENEYQKAVVKSVKDSEKNGRMVVIPSN